MALEASQSALLAAWQSAKSDLDIAKEAEAQLRATVGLSIFADADIGANTIELGGGYRATYTKKMNYTLAAPLYAPEMSVNDAVEVMAEAMRKASNEGAFIFSRLVKWKPELSLTEYKQLPDNLKKIVDQYVVSREGAPTLVIKEPAKAKGR
jgi:hypothetical protein